MTPKGKKQSRAQGSFRQGPQYRENLAQRTPIHIIPEGRRTEPDYFRLLETKLSLKRVSIKLLRTNDRSSPKSAIASIERGAKYKPDGSGESGDIEKWAVYDDNFDKPEVIEGLNKWQSGDGNNFFVLSRPEFEYWLLLHFEESKKIDKGNLKRKLEQHLPGYKKDLKISHSGKFTEENILEAVKRAKRSPKFCEEGADVECYTEVYKLIERILELESKEG